MAGKKTGKEHQCPICGTWRYWSKADIKYGRGKTCGSPECRSKRASGEGNPFWGKTHSEETRQKIKEGRAKNPPKGTGPKKGVFKHSEEAKKRIGIASKKLWKEHREMMLKSLPSGWDSVLYKPPEERRYRKNFSRRQRREWKDAQCAYCGTSDHLELDHIIPIFDGGSNMRENCQTLCRGCNLFKSKHVDIPRCRAFQAAKGAKESNPL